MPDFVIYIYNEEVDRVAEIIGKTLRKHFRRYRVEATDGERRELLEESPTANFYA